MVYHPTCPTREQSRRRVVITEILPAVSKQGRNRATPSAIAAHEQETHCLAQYEILESKELFIPPSIIALHKCTQMIDLAGVVNIMDNHYADDLSSRQTLSPNC